MGLGDVRHIRPLSIFVEREEAADDLPDVRCPESPHQTACCGERQSTAARALVAPRPRSLRSSVTKHVGRVRWTFAAMLFAAALVTGTAPGGHAAVDDRHGCVPDRPALAHHPGGPPLVPQPAGAPIPCGVLTGFAGAETRIVVDRAGAVFFDPAIADPGPTSCVVRCARAGLAISADEGAT